MVDVLGPNSGTGDGTNWGSDKRLVRKPSSQAGTSWDENQWTTYYLDTDIHTPDVAVANHDAANLGSFVPGTGSSSNTNLTYFTFETVEPRGYGQVDQAAHTVTLELPAGTSPVLSPTVSTEGARITRQGQTVISGRAVYDFSQAPVFMVEASDGTTQAYTTVLSYYHIPQFVTTAYTFDGGIGQALATGTIQVDMQNINLRGSTYNTGDLTGILTAKDIYVTAAFQYCYTIQDKNAGILVLSSASLKWPVGAKITVRGTVSQAYFGMPEVYTNTGTSRVDPTDIRYDIRYETGDFGTSSALGRVYSWSGTLEMPPVSKFEGLFTGDMYFHTGPSVSSLFSGAQPGTYYGPVSLSYGHFRMELTSASQVAP